MSFKKRGFEKSLLIIAALFITLTPEGILASDNVLLDPGFEDTSAGQAPAFPPWREWYDTNEAMTGSTGGEVTDEVSHGGRHSAVRYVKGRTLSCYAQTVKVVPKEIIEGGIWIKTSKNFSNAKAYLRIEFKTKDGTIIQGVESKRITSPNKTWKLYTIEAVPVPDRAAVAVFCIFLMGKDKNSRGKAWFDDGYMYVKIKGLV